MIHFAFLLMALGLLMLTLLGAYVFLHRKEQLSDLKEVAEDKSRGAAA